MNYRKAILFLVVVVIMVLLFSRVAKAPTKSLPQSPTVTQKTPEASFSAGLTLGVATKTTDCVSINGLPDKQCTPGAVDPTVTQDNLDQTICMSGYTKGVRPPGTYTNKLKLEQIGEYNYSDTNLKDYEEDHLISLELGGAPSDPANLWPELGASPNEKDKIENLCHQKVCSGQISLKDAQIQIATDWHTACQ